MLNHFSRPDTCVEHILFHDVELKGLVSGKNVLVGLADDLFHGQAGIRIVHPGVH
jgi:hypothetical protein